MRYLEAFRNANEQPTDKRLHAQAKLEWLSALAGFVEGTVTQECLFALWSNPDLAPRALAFESAYELYRFLRRIGYEKAATRLLIEEEAAHLDVARAYGRASEIVAGVIADFNEAGLPQDGGRELVVSVVYSLLGLADADIVEIIRSVCGASKHRSLFDQAVLNTVPEPSLPQ